MFLRRRTKKDSPTVSHKSTTTKQRGKKKTNEKPIDTHTNADGSQLARSWRFPLPATALQGAQQHITAQQLVSSPLLKGGLLHFSFCYFIIFIYVYIFFFGALIFDVVRSYPFREALIVLFIFILSFGSRESFNNLVMENVYETTFRFSFFFPVVFPILSLTECCLSLSFLLSVHFYLV